MDPAVKAVFDAHPAAVRARLLKLRALIFAAAKASDVGALTETLKWGQPAYLPKAARTGTTIRIDTLKGSDGKVAMFVPCQTTLIASFRERYGDQFVFEGKRAIIFSPGATTNGRTSLRCRRITRG